MSVGHTAAEDEPRRVPKLAIHRKRHLLPDNNQPLI
jgi:hypothetical protein